MNAVAVSSAEVKCGVSIVSNISRKLETHSKICGNLSLFSVLIYIYKIIIAGLTYRRSAADPCRKFVQGRNTIKMKWLSFNCYQHEHKLKLLVGLVWFCLCKIMQLFKVIHWCNLINCTFHFERLLKQIIDGISWLI